MTGNLPELRNVFDDDTRADEVAPVWRVCIENNSLYRILLQHSVKPQRKPLFATRSTGIEKMQRYRTLFKLDYCLI